MQLVAVESNLQASIGFVGRNLFCSMSKRTPHLFMHELKKVMTPVYVSMQLKIAVVLELAG